MNQVELLEQANKEQQINGEENVFSSSFILEHQIGEDLVDEEDRQQKKQKQVEDSMDQIIEGGLAGLGSSVEDPFS